MIIAPGAKCFNPACPERTAGEEPAKHGDVNRTAHRREQSDHDAAPGGRIIDHCESKPDPPQRDREPFFQANSSSVLLSLPDFQVDHHGQQEDGHP